MKSLTAPRGFLGAAAVLFLALVWSAASQKSETIDEGLFIADGVAQVSLLDPNFDMSHPPLLRWVAGSSAMLFGGARLTSELVATPRGATQLNGYHQDPEFNATANFFYDRHHSHDRVLFWGRFPFAFIAVIAALLIFRLVSRAYGEPVGAIASAVFLFTPEVLAHSEWAHSDVAAALATLVVALALAQSTEHPSPRADLKLGAALGIAVLAKITSTALVPVALVVVIVFHIRARLGRMNLLRRLATISGIVWIVIIVGYLPRPRLFPHEFVASDIATAIHSPVESRSVAIAADVLRYVPLPDGFMKGLVYTKLLSNRGQVSFFHGEVRTTGWWYYYPAAFLLKYPPWILLLSFVGLFFVWRKPELTLEQKVAWTAPPVALMLLAMNNRVNIGVRAVLPIAPFLALWCAAAIAAAWNRRAARTGAIALAALSIASGIAAYPNFLTYFTPVVGGTRAADRWLVDSNFDWGQDLPALAKALKRRNADVVHLAFFGAGRPNHYRIQYEPITNRKPGWYAVSRSFLSGWWPPGDPYRWLREREPDELVGGSIALFKVGDDAAATGDSTSADESAMKQAMDVMYDRHDPASALPLLDQILKRNPHHYGAMWQRAAALDELHRRDEAVSAWQQVISEAESQHYSDGVAHARERLSALLR